METSLRKGHKIASISLTKSYTQQPFESPSRILHSHLQLLRKAVFGRSFSDKMLPRQVIALIATGLGIAVAREPTQGIRLDSRGHEMIRRDEALTQTNTLFVRDLPVGTCDANTPCPNGACCGSDNLCGYTPKQCGAGCRFNCNAKAECGPYAPTNSQGCPLSVCCSEFGFCGSTDEFCKWTNDKDSNYPACSTKYGGCGPVNRPSCGGGNSVSKRTIGYYETWSNSRKASPIAPEDLNLNGFTHINFAFSFFDASSFEITSMDSNAASLYHRFTALKEKKSGLQAWISVGGWSFTDPGPTQKAFTNMVSSQSNRGKFINNLKQFMDTYAFDGVDLDWEYPGADDRGGESGDSANYVLLTKEMRAAFGTKYGISMTLPTSYWYLQHFDLVGIQQNIDWFNLMCKSERVGLLSEQEHSLILPCQHMTFMVHGTRPRSFSVHI